MATLINAVLIIANTDYKYVQSDLSKVVQGRNTTRGERGYFKTCTSRIQRHFVSCVLCTSLVFRISFLQNLARNPLQTSLTALSSPQNRVIPASQDPSTGSDTIAKLVVDANDCGNAVVFLVSYTSPRENNNDPYRMDFTQSATLDIYRFPALRNVRLYSE
jgi:hypothetical protein